MIYKQTRYGALNTIFFLKVKVVFFVLMLCLVAKTTFSQNQVPYGFNYQSIARDAMGLPIANTQISLRISILSGNPVSGTLVWQENQSARTNQFGLVNLVIGKGSRTAGTVTDFSGIAWASANYFIKVELDNNGTFVDLGTSQFQSVPYALSADNALKIQNSRISGNTPADGMVLRFNGATNQWEPQNIVGANGGTVTTVTALGPLSVLGNGGLNPQLKLGQATATSDGYLSASDYQLFDAKLSTSTGFAGDVSGTYTAIVVDRIKGTPVSATPPTDGQVLRYNNTNSQWEPVSVTIGTVTTVTSTGPISVINGGSTPEISISQASATADGYLSSLDWATFNNKLSNTTTVGGDLSGNILTPSVIGIRGVAITATAPSNGQVLQYNSGTSTWELVFPSAGTVTTVTANGPLSVVSGGTTPIISISQSNASTDGYISAADWLSFNQKLGTATGFGGDVTGTFANLSVGSIGGVAFSMGTPVAGQVLSFNGSAFVPGTPTVFSQVFTSITGNGFTVASSGQSFTIPGLSSNTLGVITNGLTIEIATASGANTGVLRSQDFNIFSNKIGEITGGSRISITTAPGGFVTITGAASAVPSVLGINGITINGVTGGTVISNEISIAGPVFNGDLVGSSGMLTVVGLGGRSINLNTLVSGQVLSFNGTAFVPAFIPASQEVSIAGINGISIQGSGYAYSVSGNGLISSNTLFGGNVSGTYNALTVTGLQNVPITFPGLTSGQVIAYNGTSFVSTTLGTVSSQWTSTTTGTASGVYFASGNVSIGTDTISGARLKVAGDLSAGGQVLASATMNPIGASANTFSLIHKQRIYIPAGTHSLMGSFNAYKYLNSGTGTIRVQIGSQFVDLSPADDDPNSAVEIPAINVSSMQGTFQTIQILGQADALAQGVILQGYTIQVKD